jgi:hypothetical protein
VLPHAPRPSAAAQEAQVSAVLPLTVSRLLAAAALACVAAVLLGSLGTGAASTVGPVPPPSNAGCSGGVIQGYETPGGDLVLPYQYQPLSGATCFVSQNATIGSPDLLFYVYSPSATGVIPIAVEEFDWKVVPEPGPNGTTVTEQVPTNVVWSNATVDGEPGWFGFTLTPPPQYAPTQLVIGLLGLTFHLVLEISPLLQPIGPTTLAEEIVEHATWLAVGLVVFVLAFPVSRAIVRRLRFVRSILIPGGLFALGIVLFLAVGYFGYPAAFAQLLAALPSWWIYGPFFVAGVLFWVRAWPGEASYIAVQMPSVRLVEGHTTGEERSFRVHTRKDGSQEYVRRGLRAALGRLFGLNWELDLHVLTDHPYFLRNAAYRNPKGDTQGWYRSFAATPGRRPPVEDFRPRVWFLPRREAVKKRRREWLRKSGRDPSVADDAGTLFAADHGVRRVAAVDAPTFMLLEGYVWRTTKLTEIVDELHRVKRSFIVARIALVTKVHDLAARFATISRITRQFPGNSRAVQDLQDLAERYEAELFGTGGWLEELRQREATALRSPGLAAKPDEPDDKGARRPPAGREAPT